jgi:hypothetical protein
MGLWIFGIIVGIIGGAFYKVKYGKNIFNIIVLAILAFWVIVLPIMLVVFIATLSWDGLLLLFKKILNSDKPIDLLTKSLIEWIDDEIINYRSDW